MALIQLLVQSDSYAQTLSALLTREGCEVVLSTRPDFELEGSIVADREALERNPMLLSHPDRIILITPNDQGFLSLLWEHNIRSVVFESDPPETVLLAVLGAGIRLGIGGSRTPVRQTSAPIGASPPLLPVSCLSKHTH